MTTTIITITTIMKHICMADDFVIRALIAGMGVALIAGPLGCFVVWRRMSYFGDSLAHSALLGIALGLLYGINVNLGTVIVCSVFALLLVWLQQRRVLATDTLLGILAHAALSIGMVAISFLDNPRFDLHSYLFGDILTVEKRGSFRGHIAPLDFYARLRGIDNLFMDLVDNPEMVHRAIKKIVSGYKEMILHASSE